ncbi:Histidine-rich protein like [Actinidia chinensis var. chinensis]|uniref:Histidine-rich protein like n=1 Tax=Actinidia chinensis var. chinensis TaxID=1590841 RepID=A0A2R6RJ28_ACTCC|nr:Histidine-rich protein like [Actinidia chinensis var. chinensis]
MPNFALPFYILFPIIYFLILIDRRVSILLLSCIIEIEGIAIGMVGSGGRITLGTMGMVGMVGFGKDEGIWVLGKGGNVVGFGKVRAVGSVGNVGSVMMAMWLSEWLALPAMVAM